MASRRLLAGALSAAASLNAFIPLEHGPQHPESRPAIHAQVTSRHAASLMTAACVYPKPNTTPVTQIFWNTAPLPKGSNPWKEIRERNPGVSEAIIKGLVDNAIYMNNISDAKRLPVGETLNLPTVVNIQELRRTPCTPTEAAVQHMADAINSRTFLQTARSIVKDGPLGRTVIEEADLTVEKNTNETVRLATTLPIDAQGIPNIDNPLRTNIATFGPEGVLEEEITITNQLSPFNMHVESFKKEQWAQYSAADGSDETYNAVSAMGGSVTAVLEGGLLAAK